MDKETQQVYWVAVYLRYTYDFTLIMFIELTIIKETISDLHSKDQFVLLEYFNSDRPKFPKNIIWCHGVHMDPLPP